MLSDELGLGTSGSFREPFPREINRAPRRFRTHARHVAPFSAYRLSPSTAVFGSLGYAGKLYEMAWRLRGSGLSSAGRIHAIGIAANIPPLELDRMILPALESLNSIKINLDTTGRLHSVEAVLPPPAELLAAAPRIMAIASLDSMQLAALDILRATTLQPLERATALETAAEHGEQAAEEALRHLVALNLVKEVEAADGRSAVFNPNIWVGDADTRLLRCGWKMPE